jgi:hypothetical protein
VCLVVKLRVHCCADGLKALLFSGVRCAWFVRTAECSFSIVFLSFFAEVEDVIRYKRWPMCVLFLFVVMCAIVCMCDVWE